MNPSTVNYWLAPTRKDIFEALGCLADGRIRQIGDRAKVYSSKRNRFYIVIFDESHNEIMANDNTSYLTGRLGYPSIAMLMLKGQIQFDEKTAGILKNIVWRDLNESLKGDINQIEAYVEELVCHRGYNLEIFLEDICYIEAQIKIIKPRLLGRKIRPPK